MALYYGRRTLPISCRRAYHSAIETVLPRLGLSSHNPGVFNAKGWVNGSGETVELRDPATRQTIGTVSTGNQEDALSTIEDAKKAFQQWKVVPPPKRGEVLRKIRERLADRKSELGYLVSLEMGKVLSEGLGEVQEYIDILDFAVGLTRSIGGQAFASEREEHSIIETCNPLGVVGCISAFNFPVAVFGWNAALALACGDAIVWKPSETTPLTAIATTKIMTSVLEEEGYDANITSLVTGGAAVGDALVSSKDVPLISFTGSEKVGKLVSANVGQRLGKCILELGGNNAAIVAKDANQELALQNIVFAALGTAGQRCTSTRRLIVDESIAESFISRMKAAYQSIIDTRMGHPLDPNTLVGPLHSANAIKAFEGAIKDAKEQGGRVLVGGNVVDDISGFFVEPTMIEIDPSAPIVQKETFAPILYVSRFNSLDEAISLNNSVEQGLSSALFTNDLRNAMRWLGPNGSDCGLVNINGSTSGAEIGAPFGGNKSTGWGRESGGDAWKAYCRWSSCTINYRDKVGLAQGVTFDV